jgi:hypothetical protein
MSGVTNEAKSWAMSGAKLLATNSILATNPIFDRTFAMVAPTPSSSSLFRGDPSTNTDVRQSPCVKAHIFETKLSKIPEFSKNFL